MPFFRSLIVLLAAASLCWADHEVRTLGNQTIRGTVIDLNKQEVSIKNEDGEIKKIPIATVVDISIHPAKKKPGGGEYTLLQLYDESQLYCKTVSFKGSKLHIELLSGQKAVLPLESVTGLLRDAQKEKLRKQFAKLVAEVTKSDRILVKLNDQLNAVSGAFGDVGPAGKKIQFRLEGLGVIKSFTIAKMQGMIWHRIKTTYKAPVCMVIDTTGNTLAAKDVALKGEKFIVTMATGDKIEFAESALAKLDYNRGKLTFLSDLEPAARKSKSVLGFPDGFLFRENRSLENQPIVIGKTTYDKGLALHSHYEVEYDLGGKFKEFRADLGVDARAPLESRAIVIIQCDGVQVFRKQVDMTTTIPINLNVRNVQKLRIIVTSRDDEGLIARLGSDDRATLANARIIQ